MNHQFRIARSTHFHFTPFGVLDSWLTARTRGLHHRLPHTAAPQRIAAIQRHAYVGNSLHAGNSQTVACASVDRRRRSSLSMNIDQHSMSLLVCGRQFHGKAGLYVFDGLWFCHVESLLIRVFRKSGT